MRVYYHPSVGEYARYDSFEIDHAALAGVPSGIAIGIAGMALKRASNEVALASIIGSGLMAGVFGKFYPKRILSWFNPPPFDAPLLYPRQIPKAVVPSFIGDKGQVLNLLMCEGTGNVVKDYSGNNNHGSIVGDVGWIDGEFGWALNFKGVSGQYVTVPNAPSHNITSELTIEYWLYPLSLPAPANEHYNISHKEWDVWRSHIQMGKSTLYCGTSVGGTYTFVGYDLPAAKCWYHVVFTAKSGRQELFVNGVSRGYKTQTGSLKTSTKPLLIGVYGDLAHPHLGYLCMFRVYNRVLTNEEILYHFNSTRAIFGV